MDIVETPARMHRWWPFGVGLLIACILALIAALAFGGDTQTERLHAAREQILTAAAPVGVMPATSCAAGHRCLVVSQSRDQALEEIRHWLIGLGYGRAVRICLPEQPSTEPCVVQGLRQDIKVTALSLPGEKSQASTRIDISVLAVTFSS